MGVCLCPRHGRTGISLVCSHVRAAIDADAPVAVLDRDVEGMLSLWMCDVCAAELDGIVGDEALEAFLGRICPVCGRCGTAWRYA